MTSQRRIVFVSHTHAAGVFRVGSHHLAREMSRLGYRVAHISTPYSLAHAALNKGAEGRREQADRGPFIDADGVLQLVPRTVLPVQYSTSRYLSRALTRHGFRGSDFMIVDQPLMVTKEIAALAKTVVYRPTDLYISGNAARKQDLALQLAQGVVATSEEVLRSLKVPAGIPSAFLPNGVELSRFANAGDRVRSGSIYVGALDDRFDWDAIRSFALAAPESPLRLAGPIASAVPALPQNVEILGPVPYESVPSLLASARIGLLPFSDAESNRGRSPMKLYEYLASGLFVVSRHTPVIASYSLPGVHLYEQPEEVASLFTGGTLPDGINADGAHSAREQDWTTKAQVLEKFLLALP
jgi:teichuronic acid biosynthesis glycosyltransferase TuaH